jgi:hypothetical protein
MSILHHLAMTTSQMDEAGRFYGIRFEVAHIPETH